MGVVMLSKDDSKEIRNLLGNLAHFYKFEIKSGQGSQYPEKQIEKINRYIEYLSK